MQLTLRLRHQKLFNTPSSAINTACFYVFSSLIAAMHLDYSMAVLTAGEEDKDLLLYSKDSLEVVSPAVTSEEHFFPFCMQCHCDCSAMELFPWSGAACAHTESWCTSVDAKLQ